MLFYFLFEFVELKIDVVLSIKLCYV